MLTLGTGIGSALFRDGVLLPNTELGHLQVRGKDAERRAAASNRVSKGLSWHAWSKRLAEYVDDHRHAPLARSRDHRRRHQQGGGQVHPRAAVAREVRPGSLQNQAGIVGAAMLAAEAAQLTAPPRLRGGRVDGARGAGAPARARTATGGYLPIEDHGVIGNLHTVALVGNEGTIDWFCPERFDAPSMFGSILDADSGGSFSLQPVGEPFTTKQLYLPGTAVLVTRFFTEGGVGEITDFMPLDGQQLLDRAPHRGRARLLALPLSVPSRVRLRARAAQAGGRRTTGDLPGRGHHVRAAVGDGRARGGRGTRRRRADARPRRVRLVRALGGQARAVWDEAQSTSPFARPSTSGAGGSVRAPIAGAGARSSTARRSRSSCSPTCRRARSSRRPRPACPSTSAGRATGTTATAGCATRRSRCSRSCAWASARRRSPT